MILSQSRSGGVESRSLLPGRPGDLVALVAGLLLPFAFAPVSFWPLAYICTGALMALWPGESIRRCALRGLLFGIGSFGVGTSWIYHSLHTFGGMPPAMAAGAVALLTVLLAIFPAAGGAAAVWFSRGLPMWLAFPVAWTFFEWLRAQGVWAFSWLSIGYSQADTPLAGFAPVFGIYGVSFAMALVVAALVCVLHSLIHRAPARQPVMALTVLVLVVVSGAVLQTQRWSEADGESLTVALVQGNTDITSKWEPDQRPVIRARYMDLSFGVPEADLVIWPESAIPYPLQSLRDDFYQELSRHRADFVFGVIELLPGEKKGEAIIYNSAAVVSDAPPPAIWRKSHLVPFGEYLPFADQLSWVLEFLNIPMSDIRPYTGEQGAIAVAGTRIGISICFEDAFPRDMLSTVPEAGLLVHISEDAWFGDSFGPPQRLEMGRMRALEFSRPMVRASNTGVTGVINERGEVLATLAQFKRQVLVHDVSPQRGVTPFMGWQHWPVLGLVLVLALVGTVRARQILPKNTPG